MTPAELAFYNRQQQDVAPNVGLNYGIAPIGLPAGWNFRQAPNEGPASGWVTDPSGKRWIGSSDPAELEAEKSITAAQAGFQPGPGGTFVDPKTGIKYMQTPDGRWLRDEESNIKWANEQQGTDIFGNLPTIAAGAVLAAAGGGFFDSLVAGGAGAGAAGGAGGLTGAGTATWPVNPITGGSLYSAEGFVPGAFDIGASGYGGTAAAGLDAAAAEWAAGAGAAGGGAGGEYAGSAGGESSGFPGDPGNVTATGGSANVPVTGGAGGGANQVAQQAAKTALGKLLSGEGSVDDYLKAIGALGAAGLGYAGAQSQADAYKDVANQQFAIGAPFRDELLASYKPGFNLWDKPGYAGAFQQTGQDAARAVSAGAGNPYGSPGAMNEIQEGIMNRAYLPALTNYRGGLGQFGGLGLNQSGQASMAAAAAGGGTYNALGAGLNMLTQPDDDIAKLLKTRRDILLA